MPTRPKTSKPELVAIARRLTETHGADAVTLNAVAQSAGVKAPSLYKHFADRDALLRAVEIDILTDLEKALRAGTEGSTIGERVYSMAAAYRNFAREQPHRYGIIYSRDTHDDPELAEACRRAATPLFEELRQAGLPEARIFPLVRTLGSFLHGFVSIEIVGAFTLGGDLDADFDNSLRIILGEVR